MVLLDEVPDPARVAAVDPEQHLPDRFAVVGRDVHVWYPEERRASRLTHDFWERRLGLVGSARSRRPLTALQGMLTGA